MADKKISQLTAASTPLAGTEVLPVVQSGTTKQVSVANLTAGRSVAAQKITLTYTSASADAFTLVNTAASGKNWLFGVGTGAAAGDFGFYNSSDALVSLVLKSAGDVNVNAGNLVVGTAAKGIDFSANTHAAGMTSELLDWYEEGTFTPTVIGTTSAGTATYATQTGTYTRIGNRVLFQIYVSYSSHTGTGDMRISGLPFAAASGDTLHSLSVWSNGLALTASNTLQAYVIAGQALIALQQVPVGGGGASNVAIDDEAGVMLSGHYLV